MTVKGAGISANQNLSRSMSGWLLLLLLLVPCQLVRGGKMDFTGIGALFRVGVHCNVFFLQKLNKIFTFFHMAAGAYCTLYVALCTQQAVHCSSFVHSTLILVHAP